MSFVVCQGPPQQGPSYHGMLYIQRSHTDCILISGNGANADEGTLYVQVDLSRPGARLPYEQVREALVGMLKNGHVEPYEMGTEQLLAKLVKFCEEHGKTLHLDFTMRKGKPTWRCQVIGVATANGESVEDALCNVLTPRRGVFENCNEGR